MITKSIFGSLSDGRPVTLYQITNAAGAWVQILDYGATVHGIAVPDRAGRLGDVVLGAADAAQLEGFCLAGATIGRCANRIADAQFSIGGKTYHLEPSRGGHCLHSGSGNYANRFFRVTPLGENTLCCTLRDNGEGGFETPVDARVEFTFDDNCALTIRYVLTAHGDTVLNPTNHSYFNLGCEDSRDHLLWLWAETYAPVNGRQVPDGTVAPVADTPLDFRQERRIRDALQDGAPGFFPRQPEYDHNLLLGGKGMRKAARLRSEETGRVMEVFTDMPSVVLFTFGGNREIPGKYGQTYRGFRSVCIETQYPVNAVNCPPFPSPVFHAGETLDSTTVYAFSCE